jgi:hypothetical protein
MNPPLSHSRRSLVTVIGLAALGAAAFPHSALAFSKKGHQIVGAIADERIKGTNAEKKVKEILGSESLSHASTWADEVKHGPFTNETKAYAARNKHQRENHFADIPIQAKAYSASAIGAGPDDVVATIRRCIKVLESGKDDLTITQKEALKVLVHMVGDVHQPLHVGSIYLDKQGQMVLPKNKAEAQATFTTGGNDLDFHGNLHSHWDDDAVNHAMSKAGKKTTDVKGFAHVLATHEPAGWQTGSFISQWGKRWATEMLPLAASAYGDLTIHPQTSEMRKNRDGELVRVFFWPAEAKNEANYKSSSADVVSQNLARAGWRLTALLEKIWP